MNMFTKGAAALLVAGGVAHADFATLVDQTTIIDNIPIGSNSGEDGFGSPGYAVNRGDGVNSGFIDAAMLSFDFGATTSVSQATLTINVDTRWTDAGQNPTIYLYAGPDDGTIQVSDITIGGGAVRDAFTYTTTQTRSIDVTAAVNSALAVSQYVGFRFENSRSPFDLPNALEGIHYADNPVLEYTPGASGGIVIDTIGSWDGNRSSGWKYTAQTFLVPAGAPRLETWEVGLGSDAGVGGTYMLDVHPWDASLNHVTGGSLYNSGVLPLPDGIIQFIDHNVGVDLTPGGEYAMVVTFNPDGTGNGVTYIANSVYPDGYATFTNGAIADPWSFDASSNFEHAFRAEFSGGGGGGMMYATNNLAATNGYTSGGDQLITFDPTNPGGWSAVGEIVDGAGPVSGLGGLDFDSSGGLWAADSFGSNPGGIYRVNPMTAQATLVGNTQVPMHDLAWNPVRNDLYGTDAAGNLYRNVDDPPNAQLVGTYNIPTPLEVGIAFDSQGNIYVHDIVNDAIYRAPAGNLTNTSLLYTLPFDSNFSQGLFVNWSRANGGFHGAFNNSAFTSEVHAFDVTGGGYGPLLGTFPTDGGTGLPEVETGDLTMRPASNQPDLYASNNLAAANGYTSGGDQLIRFDPTNPGGWGAIGEIVDNASGRPIDGIGGLDFDAQRNLWGTTSFGGSPGQMWVISPVNARASFVGSLPTAMSDLAWNPRRMDLFGTDAAGNLWANVDDPPNAQFVGTYNIPNPLEVGIAFDSQGNLYVHDLINDAIYRAPAGNLTNTSLLYNLPFDSNFSQGLFVHWSGANQGIHGAFNNSAFTSETWAFDVAGGGYGPQLGTFPTDGGTGLPEVETGDLTAPPPPPPCKPDLNGDGTVNSQDFVLFLNLFVAGDLRADYNNDGTVNSQDFVSFLNDFVAGC
jgi:hypothetical protein